jgi:hypothetical protein
MGNYERNIGGLVWSESIAITCDFISIVANGRLAEDMVSLFQFVTLCHSFELNSVCYNLIDGKQAKS